MPKEITSWSEVIGNKYYKEMIINAIKRNALSSFILFEGSAGIGKSTFAKMTAKTIVCEHKNEEGLPCGVCDACKEVDAGGSGVAYKKYNMPTLVKKSDVNETISEIFQLKKLSNVTVYVLEEMHGLSKELQTLLLEELTKIPKDVYIMSCTTRSYDLLPEIRNRALQIKLLDPTEQECFRYARKLANEYGITVISDKALKMLSAKCDYSPRKISEIIRVVAIDNKLSEETLRKLFGTVSDKNIIDYLDAVINPTNTDLYKFVATLDILQETTNLYQLNRQSLDILFEYILLKGSKGKEAPSINQELQIQLNNLFDLVDIKDIVKVLKEMGDINIKESESKSSQKAKLLSMKVRLGKFEKVQSEIQDFSELKDNHNKIYEDKITSEFNDEGSDDITLESRIEGIFTELQFGDEYRNE